MKHFATKVQIILMHNWYMTHDDLMNELMQDLLLIPVVTVALCDYFPLTWSSKGC